MGWSRPMQIYFFRAAEAAGWNEQQRYIVMRHAGCAEKQRAAAKGSGTASEGQLRPSANDARNTIEQWELCMCVAQAGADERGNGAAVPKSIRGIPWGDVERLAIERMRFAIGRVWEELVLRMPDLFHPDGLPGFVQRMTEKDQPQFVLGAPPRTIADCDAAQLHRVLEGIKAWGTRRCLERDITPKTFHLNARERARHFARVSA